jgi:hypothetical protein
VPPATVKNITKETLGEVMEKVNMFCKSYWCTEIYL